MPGRVHRRPRAAALPALVAGLALLVSWSPALADYEVALELYRAGEYEKAAEEILVSLELAPDYAYGRALLGTCKLRLREYDEAAEAFGRAIRIEPAQPSHRLMLIQALYLADRGTEALGELDRFPPRALANSEITLQATRWRGLVLARLGRCDEAVAHLVAAGAGDQAVAGTLARCARRPGTATPLGDAIGALRAARSLEPPVARALGRAHVESADFEQNAATRRAAYEGAARWLAAETSRLSGDSELLTLLGRARLGAGDLAGAETALENALAGSAPPCRAWLSLAEARARAERWTPALEAARQAVSCEPERARARVILAAAYNGLSLPDEAEEAARGALEIGESTEARRQIAMAQAIREHQAQLKAQEEADEEALRRWKAITGRD